MKGIILAGGSGTRLYPITMGISKQLLPIYDKPMIYYPLSVLMESDIKDILIITTYEDQPMFKKLLGDGSTFGVNLEYAIQEHPNGLAEAFIIGEDFIGDDSVCLILGDNIFHGPNLAKRLLLAKKIACDEVNPRAVIFGYEVSDPSRYGVAEVIKNRSEGYLYTVNSLQEKPVDPKSNIAVTGLYFYPNSVIEIAKRIKPSERGELEITEVNKQFNDMTANDGGSMLDLILLDRGYAWLDTGTFDSLHEAAGYVETIEKRQGIQISSIHEIAYTKKWITKDELNNFINNLGNNSYKKYLMNII